MGSTILLADDSITIQKVVNLTFADEGIDVVAVSSGDLAERRLGEINPDLVLADIFMPGKNGYQLCEAIKQDPKFRNVPVVLLVGAFEPFDQAEARRVRADAHLTKPFESRTLVETVRRLVGESPHDVSKPPFTMAEPSEERAEIQAASPAVASTAVPAVHPDFSAMMTDNGRATLPSEIAGEHAPEDFEVGDFNVPPQDTVTVLTDVADPFDSIEFSPSDELAREKQSPFDAHVQEMFLDFNRADSPESSSASGVISFEAPTPTGVVELSGELDAGNDNQWQIADVAAPIDETLPDIATSPQAYFVGTEDSTLLAADEPLGDVLFDEGTHPLSAESASSEPGQVPQAQFALVSEESMDQDWTSPRPGAYSTAQLDSIEMPAEIAQQVAVNLAAADTIPAEDASQPNFANTAIWTEQETRFTPIDIEAVAVEEANVQTGREESVHAGSPAAEAVSSAAIEEIVRQVVAQISDSVIREVAWEVVPDCVERVIERLARESLSKRM
jgi:CheY-like chemotaxis protein